MGNSSTSCCSVHDDVSSAEAESVPFLKCHQLDSTLDGDDDNDDNDNSSAHVSTLRNDKHLPGQPRIQFTDLCSLSSFLDGDLCSAELEQMAPFLWMMSFRSSANISPLHRQRVKGREVVISEDPKLHLVWLPDRIYIKPLPRYLLSHVFWNTYLLPHKGPMDPQVCDRVRKAALGYVRSYYHLVKHESDFIIAQENHLLPTHITWNEFSAFISDFGTTSDDCVAARYSFGELRLARLNFYIKFVLYRYQFQYVHTSYGTYFSRFYGPFLFIFGMISVALSAFQVWVQASPPAEVDKDGVYGIARVFSILTIFLITWLLLLLASLGLYRFAREWQHAIRAELARRKRQQSSSVTGKNGAGTV